MSRPRQIKSTDGAIWRVGRVRNPDGARVRVVLEPLSRRIKIAISGANRKEALFLVRNDIEHIHETLNNPEVQKMVPCVCGKCRAGGEPGFFEHGVLNEAKDKGITELLCMKSFAHVTIDELLAGIKETRADKAKAREDVMVRPGSGTDLPPQLKPGGFFSKLNTYVGFAGVLVALFVAYFALRDSTSFKEFCRDYETCRKAFSIPLEKPVAPPKTPDPKTH